ncbi:MAG: hypothetical protein ACR2QK_15145, partial [Acidimicrobiales bacterium]
VLVDEDFCDTDHPDYERFKDRHSDEDGHHHGFTMVEATEMGRLLSSVGLIEIEADKRLLAGRPVIAITARR